MDPVIEPDSIVKNLNHDRRWNFLRTLRCQTPDARRQLTLPGPKLTHAQWEICEAYGGWTSFIEFYELKRPWEKAQSEQGVEILEIIARHLEDSHPESPKRTAF